MKWNKKNLMDEKRQSTFEWNASWKSQNGKRVKWIFHELLKTKGFKEMQESWFWHDFRDFWIFVAIANLWDNETNIEVETILASQNVRNERGKCAMHCLNPMLKCCSTSIKWAFILLCVSLTLLFSIRKSTHKRRN
jgi:hypothetical protein